MFRDRYEAGQKLVEKIKTEYPELVDAKEALVLGIPRGGVVVAAVVARELSLPLDLVIVRKLGVPGHEELAFGAVDLNGQMVLNREIVESLGLGEKDVERVKERELAEAKRREQKFRAGRRSLDLKGEVVLLVDDGVATGATTEAAINYIVSFGPKEIVLATPVIAADTLDEINSKLQITNNKWFDWAHHPEPDEGQIQNTKNSPPKAGPPLAEKIIDLKSKISTVYLEAPLYFAAVGQFYQDFPQTTDEEVIKLLSKN